MARVVLKGIQGPGGTLIPTELLVHYAVNVPQVRDEVVKQLKASGYLEDEHLKPAGFWRRLVLRLRQPTAKALAG